MLALITRVIRNVQNADSGIKYRADTEGSRATVNVSSYGMAYYELPDIRVFNVAQRYAGEAIEYVKELCDIAKKGNLHDGSRVRFFDGCWIEAILDRSNFKSQNQYGVFVLTPVRV